MRLIIIGSQGSGKGTHAKKLAMKLGVPQISTGDLLREMAKQETEEGQKIRSIINRGVLVPDGIMLGILKKRLEEDDAKKGFILDGFPRNRNQAEMLESAADIDHVIHLNVSDAECIRRLAKRKTCKKCGAIYGNESLPSIEGRCDACGGELYVREDDKEEVIRKRLELYHEQTEPILDFYRENGLLMEIRIEGIRQPEEVFRDICDAIGI